MPKRKSQTTKNASVLAAYHVNRFLIDSVNAQLIDENGELESNNLFTFFHEYIHYWNNISTVVAVSSLVDLQAELSLFSHAATTNDLGQFEIDLTNLPSDCNSKLQNIGLRTLIREGDIELPCNYTSGHSFQITGVSCEQKQHKWERNTMSNHIVWVSFETSIESGRFAFGSHIIEESLTALLEEELRSKLGSADVTNSNLPEFPYRVAGSLWKHITDEEPPRESLAELLTCCLNTSYPGETFLKIASAATEEDTSIDSMPFRESTKSFLEQNIHLIHEELEHLNGIHENRGPIEKGIDYISDKLIKNLEKRRQDLCFDLNTFLSPDREAIKGHLNQHPPCDIRSQNELFRYGEAQGNDGLRIFHCAVQTMKAFLNELTFKESATENECPLFNNCNLDRKCSGVCDKKPWINYGIHGDKECYYGMGVAALLGQVEN